MHNIYYTVKSDNIEIWNINRRDNNIVSGYIISL